MTYLLTDFSDIVESCGFSMTNDKANSNVTTNAQSLNENNLVPSKMLSDAEA
jgi:hypothetical protein